MATAEHDESHESPSMTSTPAKSRWLPTSLRRPYIFSVATLFLLIAIAIECLRQYSSHHHGLVHLKSYTLLGQFTSGMYTYAPTAFAVLAAALWNICSLDVLRLEPYFQLAKPEGAPGTMLFTNYCFFFGIVAPIMALRNRHLIVACVSSMGLILRMVLPSLLSGLIMLDMANIISWHPVNIWPNLVSLDVQKAWLAEETTRIQKDSDISANTYLFYGHSDYAIPPISRPSSGMNHHDSTWELHHPLYWADLACTKIELYDLVPSSSSTAENTSTDLVWNIRGIHLKSPTGGKAGSKCSIDISLNSSLPTRKGPYQIRHWEPLDPHSSAYNTSTLNHTGCASFSFIGVTIDSNTLSSQNISSTSTVFGCSSTYLSSTADIMLPFNTSFTTVKNASSPKTTLTSEEFDTTGFQSLLFAKYLNNNLALWNMNYPHSIARWSESTGVNGTSIDPQSPITLGSYQQDVITLWKRHFALTMNRFFDIAAEPKHAHVKEITDKIIFGIASRSAFLAESIFLAASLILVALGFIYPRRPNFLRSDPGSIAAQCAIVTDIFVSTDRVAQSGTDFFKATPRQLRRLGRTISCRWIDTPDGKRIALMPCGEHASSTASQTSRRQKWTQARSTPRPHFLRPIWLFIECCLVIGVLTAFGISMQFINLDKFDDYYLSAGTTVLYLYLIYGPTIISSMISTLFTSVHRHLCHVEPWVQLRQGMALAGKSLTTKYSSYTSVTIWNQLRSNKPLILIVLSLVCLLDFALIIASSGMFQPVVYHWSNQTTTDLSARYNHSRFQNPDVRPELYGYNFITDILTTHDPLLSWTTSNTSFIPLTIDAVDAEYVDWMMYTTCARGVGVDLQCSQISSASSMGDSGVFNWTYKPNDSSVDTSCTVEFQKATDTQHSSNSSVYLTTPNDASTSCQKSIVVIVYDSRNETATTSMSSPVAFHCEPQIHIQDYDIRLGSSGLIKGSMPVPGGAITNGGMFQNASDSLVPFTKTFIQLDWPSILTKDFYDSIHDIHGSFSGSKQNDSIPLRAIKAIYGSTFSVHTSMWRDLYFDPLPSTTPHTTINATVSEAEWGIDPSNAVLIIMIILLSLDLSVLMAVFWFRHRYYNGPPHPQTIGSLIPWIAQSRLISDVEGTAEWGEEKRSDHLEALERRYRFGEFEVPSAHGTSARVALDWDEKYTPIERDEGYEMAGISAITSPVEESRTEISLAAAGSETTLVNTDITAHRL